MILDRLENLARYEAIGPWIAKIENYLRTTDTESLAPGRYPIDGDALYVLVQSLTLNEEPKRLEAHRRYADLQLMVHGKAAYGWSPVQIAEIDAKKDIGFTDEAAVISPVLSDGMFVIYLPGEAHMPDVYAGEASCRKLVFKALCA